MKDFEKIFQRFFERKKEIFKFSEYCLIIVSP